MKTHRYIGFANSLNEDDYGIMITPQGKIKGVWIPVKYETEPVPVAIVDICIANFGIDPNQEEHVSQTVH